MANGKAASKGKSKVEAAVKKAKNAAKSAKKGVATNEKKVRTTTHFYKPKTLRKSRDGKYDRKSMPNKVAMDTYTVIKRALLSEQSMHIMDEPWNVLTFLCDARANKNQIKMAVKKIYDIAIVRVNTLIRPDGLKKAYCKVAKDLSALTLASEKIGIV